MLDAQDSNSSKNDDDKKRPVLARSGTVAAQVMVKHHQDIPEQHADEILEVLEKNAAWQQQLFGEGACPNVSALICQAASEEVVQPDSLRNMIQFRLAHASHVSMFACAAGRFNICVLASLLSLEHWRRQSPTVLDRDPILETVAFQELVVFCSSFFALSLRTHRPGLCDECKRMKFGLSASCVRPLRIQSMFGG